jgi:glucokinase
MITLGTGIGAAAMIEGRLLRGKHSQAGCLGGHIPAVYNGRPCMCGNVGCVEAEASTWALPSICESWPGFAGSLLASEPRLDLKALFRCSAAGDGIAVAIRDRFLHVWAAGAVGLIHAYDPEVLVLGGAVMQSSGQVLPFLREYVTAHAWTPWGKVRVSPAKLGRDSALLGAIPLLSDQC